MYIICARSLVRSVRMHAVCELDIVQLKVSNIFDVNRTKHIHSRENSFANCNPRIILFNMWLNGWVLCIVLYCIMHVCCVGSKWCVCTPNLYLLCTWFIPLFMEFSNWFVPSSVPTVKHIVSVCFNKQTSWSVFFYFSFFSFIFLTFVLRGFFAPNGTFCAYPFTNSLFYIRILRFILKKIFSVLCDKFIFFVQSGHLKRQNHPFRNLFQIDIRTFVAKFDTRLFSDRISRPI